MITLNGIGGGLALIVGGTLMVKFSYQLRNITGPQDWMEKYTGAGTTDSMYKVVGVFVVLGGILWFTGLSGGFFEWLLAPLVNALKPGSI